MNIEHDYEFYWHDTPFIWKDDRAMSIKCPACNDILNSKFSLKGTEFVFSKCGFVLT